MRKESRRRTGIPGPRRGGRLCWGLLAVLAGPALADDPRDIVFDCPCRAEWTAEPPGQSGQLTLTFGVRNFRATESGAVRLSQVDLQGALGDGAGKWRLTVESSEPILAMSLLASPTGHLTNLSTAPTR